MSHRRIKIATGIALLLLTSCANIVAPTGGPKHTQPPHFVKSLPANRSANFKGDKIIITFKEFINLADAGNQVIVSPPLKELPDFRTRGKSVIVSFSEKLKDSTTYSINFGKSIQEFTENIPDSGFVFAFSTGNYTDSLSVHGRLMDAFTLEAKKGIYIMLYKKCYDSIPYKDKPDYITKTAGDGSFKIENLAPGHYMIFGLGDANNNLLFDQSTEPVAFYDSLVTPQYIPPIDTTKKKKATKDSIAVDTAKKIEIKNIDLSLFEETDTNQKLLKYKAEQIGEVKFIFKWPVRNLQFNFRKKPLSGDWRIDEYNRTRDTLICWLRDPDNDSLFMEVRDQGIVLDTLELGLKQVKDTAKATKSRTGRGGPGKNNGFNLLMTCNANPNHNLDLNRKLNIDFSHPVRDGDFSKIQLFEKKDTARIPVKASYYFNDSILKRKLVIDFPVKSKTSYELFIPPNTFKDIYGLESDTLKLKFAAADEENYRVLTVNTKISEKSPQYIFQLLDENKKVVLREKIFYKPGPVKFDFMGAGNYKARIIIDNNSNGKWDSGQYLKKIQPEKVYYFPSVITVKPNWDSEIDWQL